MREQLESCVFLSHHSADKTAVEEIKRQLESSAPAFSCWLDKDNLRAGDTWMSQVETTLAKCDSAVLFFGPHGPGAIQDLERQMLVDRAARQHNSFWLVPVLLPGARKEDVTGFAKLFAWVDFSSGLDSAAALERLCKLLRGEAPSTLDARDHLTGEPYRGLERFDGEHAGYFFGRDREIAELCGRLKSWPFVAIVGGSGSGKSSLALAGLHTKLAFQELPRLNEAVRIVVRPGANPLRALATHIAAIVPKAPGESVEKLADDFAHRFRERPDGLLTLLMSRFPDERTYLVLLIDQFEELFTLCADTPEAPGGCREQAEQFAELLDAVACSRLDNFRVVITLRADFFEKCLQLPRLKELIANHMLALGELSPEAVREVIVNPARNVGAHFEKGLVDRMVVDVGQQQGFLPLLQYALKELWAKRNGRWLTNEGYDATGGVATALRNRADATLQGLAPGQLEIARQILLRLTVVGEEDGRDTRRRTLREELYPAVKAMRPAFDEVLDRLSGKDARLIVVNANTVEITHDALLRRWDQLKQWLNTDRENARFRQRLASSANEWRNTEPGKRDASYLWSGWRLADAVRYKEQRVLNDVELAFINEALANEENLLERARKQKRVAWGIAVAAVVGAVVFILLGIIAWRQRDIARTATVNANKAKDDALAQEKLAQLAEARRTLAQADAFVGAHNWRDAARTYNLALEKFAARGMSTFPVELGKWDVCRQVPPPIQTFLRHSKSIDSVSVSADGTRVASGGEDGILRVWNIKTAHEEQVYHAGFPVTSVAFLAGNDQILIGGGIRQKSGNLELWDCTNRACQALEPHADIVRCVATSPATRRAISCGWDSKVKIWDLRGPRDTSPISPVATFDHGSEVYAVAISQDGTLGVSAGGLINSQYPEESERGKYLVKLWDLEGGTLKKTFDGHWFKIAGVAFSANGQQLLSASLDKTARVWDLNSGLELDSVQLSDGVTSVACSPAPDGQWALLGGAAGDLFLWRLGSDRPLLPLAGHQTFVTNVAFSQDGRRAVSACRDGVAHVWDTTCPTRDARVLHGDWVQSVTFSPDQDSTWLLSASARSLKLWNGVTGRFVRALESYDNLANDQEPVGPVTVGAISADASTIVSGHENGLVALWDAQAGRQKWSEKAHDQAITSLALSPDGSRILTGSRDRTLKLWIVEALQLRLDKTLDGHAHAVTSVALDPAGSRAVSADRGGALRLWDLDSGREVRQFAQEHSSRVNAVALSRDGRTMVSASSDKSVILWDVESGKSLRRFDHPASVVSVAFHTVDDGTAGLLAGCTDAKTYLWNVDNTQQPEQVFHLHQGPVLTVAFSADGQRLASGGRDDAVKLVRRHEGQRWSVKTLEGHAPGVLRIACSPDGRLALSSSGSDLKLWEVETGQLLKTLRGHRDTVWSVGFSPNGRRAVSASKDGMVRIWDLCAGQPTIGFRTAAEGPDTAISAIFVDDGRVLVGFRNNIELWGLQADVPQLIASRTLAIQGNNDSVYRVVSADDRTALVATNRQVRFVDLTSDATGLSVRPNSDIEEDSTIAGLAVAPGRSWIVTGLTGGDFGKVNLWKKSKKLLSWENGKASVLDVAFSADGQLLVSGGHDNTISLWGVDSNHPELLRIFKGHENTVRGLIFSPTPKDLASASGESERIFSAASDGTVRIWNYGRRQQYEQPHRLDDDTIRAKLLLAQWYAFRGVDDWAIELFEAARREGAEVSSLQLARCHWQRHWETGDMAHWKAARELFQAALGRDENKDDTFHLYIQLCLQSLDAQE